MARRRLLVCAAVALAAALTGCTDPPGPLKGKADPALFEARVGDHLYWGPLALQQTSLDPAQIESIEAISDDPAVRVERVYRDVRKDPTEGGGRRLQDRFRPGDLIPGDDLGVAPRSFVSGGPVLVVLVFRPPTRPGAYSWTGFRVRYRVRGRDQELVVDAPGTACIDRPRSACASAR